MQFDEIARRLAPLDTASLCDADKQIRAMDPGIRPLHAGGKLIGRACTVSCCDDFLSVIEALALAAPGEVLVIDGQGGHEASAGELFATEALRKGLAGLVVDGAVRDTATLATLELAVYARWAHPVSGTTAQVSAVGVPVTCGGVEVAAGDIVFGDADGVIVASAAELAALIPLAEDIQTREAATLARMHAGESLIEQLNFTEHLAAVCQGAVSTLRFKH